MNLIEICVHHLLLLLIVRIDLNRCETISSSKEVRPCLSKSIEEILIDSEEKTFDCSTLSSDVQTFLALQLTFCHLNSTGIDPKEICSLTRTTFNQQQCLKNLTRNPFAYLTYTNFLPHIQSLCYSIETQRWHHQTHRTIHQLHQHTDQIESEAKNLLIEQENIQHRLDQTLLINQNSVDDALSIDRFLQTAQTDVEDLRGHLYVKDKAQIELIHQVKPKKRKEKKTEEKVFFSSDFRYVVQHSIDLIHRCIWFKFVHFLCIDVNCYSPFDDSRTHERFKVQKE